MKFRKLFLNRDGSVSVVAALSLMQGIWPHHRLLLASAGIVIQAAVSPLGGGATGYRKPLPNHF